MEELFETFGKEISTWFEHFGEKIGKIHPLKLGVAILLVVHLLPLAFAWAILGKFH